MDKLKAVIYLRVSDHSQLENNSFDTQLESCRNFAHDKKYNIVKVFKEEAKSAKHIHTRPEMREMLDFCTDRKNHIAAVIVFKMDRWTRNTEEGLVAISLLAKYGVSVMPATEISEQNSMGKAMRTILMVMAELDNDLKGERVKANMQTMFRKGLWCWKPRMGYKRKYKTKEENKGIPPIPDGKLSEIIKSVFLKASEVKTSQNYLADYANNLGFKRYYGKEADGRTISRLLSDTFYYGYMYAPKWNEYAWGKHKALVSEDVWRKANVNVLGRSKIYNHQDNALYPLKGELLCASCSRDLTSSNPRGTSKNYLYYECHNAKCEKRQRVSVDVAHKEFIELIRGIMPSDRVIKLFNHLVFSEWDEGVNEKREQIRLLDEQIAYLENKLTVIAESNSKGILTDGEAQERASEVRKDLTIARVERGELKIERYDIEIVRNFAENFLLNLDKLWQHIDLPHKQALQRAIFPNKLVIENKKIRIADLSSTFKLIKSLDDRKIDLVTPREFESRFSG